MKKLLLVILSLVCVSTIIFLLLFCFVPSYYKNLYEDDKSNENLYKLCKYVYTFKNDSLILEYYPILLYETNYDTFSWEYEKDNMISKLLETSLNKSDFLLFKKMLTNACVTYSNAEIAEIFITDFINAYYKKTNDLSGSCELFEIVIMTFSDDYYKVSICGEYIDFLLINSDDTEKLEEIQNWQKSLANKAEKIIKDRWQ